MVTKAMPGAGDVEVKLGGSKIVLRPTLHAAIKLSTQPGGLSKLVARCSDLDFEAICDVIIVGAQLEVKEDTKESIFREGMLELMLPCIRFLNNLASGGKPAEEDKDEEGDKKAPLGRSSQ